MSSFTTFMPPLAALDCRRPHRLIDILSALLSSPPLPSHFTFRHSLTILSLSVSPSTHKHEFLQNVARSKPTAPFRCQPSNSFMHMKSKIEMSTIYTIEGIFMGIRKSVFPLVFAVVNSKSIHKPYFCRMRMLEMACCIYGKCKSS